MKGVARRRRRKRKKRISFILIYLMILKINGWFLLSGAGYNHKAVRFVVVTVGENKVGPMKIDGGYSVRGDGIGISVVVSWGTFVFKLSLGEITEMS